MNQHQLHDALTELPEELIASTAQIRTKKRVTWAPWVALAACACLVLVLGAQLMPMMRLDNAAPESAKDDKVLTADDAYYAGINGNVEHSLTTGTVLLVQVVEVQGNSLLVAPLEGESLGQDSRIAVPVEDGSGYAAGDKLRIRYNGMLQETWPLQLGEIFGIERIG